MTGARRGAAVVALAFGLSRIAYALAGVRFDASAIKPANLFQVQWQLLDLGLLRHDLLRSVWYLHSQPPLYNLAVGILLHLPPGARAPCAQAVFLLLGLGMTMSGYWLTTGLGVPSGIAVAVSVLMVADPTTVLYENWLSWSHPTAAFLSLGCAAALAGWRSGRRRELGVAAALLSAALLLDSTFQWPWLIAAAGLLAGVARRTAAPAGVAGGRRVGARTRAALTSPVLVPLVIVAGVYLKDAVLFGTYTTSSWMGMNLALTTIGKAPPDQVRTLVQSGRLPALAATPAFAALPSYPGYAYRSDVPAVGRPTLEGGVTNFNDGAYIAISRAYQSAALRYIRAEPGAYIDQVGRSLLLWSVPGGRYVFLGTNNSHISVYSTWFDRLVLATPEPPPQSLPTPSGRSPPDLIDLVSWVQVLVGLLALLGSPLVSRLRWRRGDRAGAGAIALMWVTVSYSVVVTSLVSYGENMRFQAELGVLPVVLAAVVLLECRPAVAAARRYFSNG